MTETEPGASRNRSLVGGLVGRVAPAVMRQIDTQDLVDSLDVDLIAQSLDVDALVDRLDVNAVAARLDLDALVDRLDIDMVAERLDLDALVDRLDVNAVAARLDLDMLVDRLDVNAIAERLDLDALVDRMDVNAIAGELDMAKLTAGATSDVAISGLDLVRRQLIRIDATVESVSDRVLRRGPGDRPDAPGVLVEEEQAEHEPKDSMLLQRRDVSGHYAGPVTRTLSVFGDIAAVAATQAVLVWVAFVGLGIVLDFTSPASSGRWLSLLMLWFVTLAWYWLPVALFGRTLAMAVMGIAVVRRDGTIVNGTRAFVRAVFFPLSILIPLSFIGLLIGKERRALHDVIAGTVVVYDWGARDAEQPVTIREQLSAQVRRRAKPPA